MTSKYLREAFRFFCANAGYSVPPGRTVCAIALARAERDAASLGMTFQWLPEWDIAGTATDEQIARIDAGETVYLQCCAYYPDGLLAASLGGIEVTGSSDPYCRVVQAELASEVL